MPRNRPPTSLSLVVLILGLIPLSSCAPRPVSHHQEEIGGVFNEMVIVGKTKSERERILRDAFEILRKIDAQIDSQNSAGEIARVNQKGFAEPQKVSPEIFEVIQRSVGFSAKTGGAFDITILPLLKVWGFKGSEPRLPRPEEIQSLLPRVGSNYLLLDPKRQKVGFRLPDMGIELAGIGRGYTCDRVIEFLKAQGISQALVNVGGTIGAVGNSPEGRAWRVGLRHPRDPTRTLRVISLTNEAVSTRGDYEKFFVLNGRRYSHILNPQTGYPATESVAVSVIAPSAFLADALSTGFFVLGPEKAPFLAKQYREARWYLTYFTNGEHFKTLSSEPAS